jgi:hypothetical protein
MRITRTRAEVLRPFNRFDYLAVGLVLLGLCCSLSRGGRLESGLFTLVLLAAVVPLFLLWWLAGLGWLCRAARGFELWSCWRLTPVLALAFYGMILLWLWRRFGF